MPRHVLHAQEVISVGRNHSKPDERMNTGALSLVHTALHAGVEICFANPGTTEMPIVAALEPGMRVEFGLFEGVCTCAADGWARITGRPAAALLHLGPGFALFPGAGRRGAPAFVRRARSQPDAAGGWRHARNGRVNLWV